MKRLGLVLAIMASLHALSFTANAAPTHEGLSVNEKELLSAVIKPDQSWITVRLPRYVIICYWFHPPTDFTAEMMESIERCCDAG